MPPRRRPAPPPANLSPAQDASAPAPGHAAPIVPDRIFANLAPPKREVYRVVFEAGSRGMSSQDIREAAGLSTAAAASNVVRSLVRQGVLKEVPDVRGQRGNRKVYMAIGFEPSDEITGGTWYHDGKVDMDAVSAARRRCRAQVERLGAATADMILQGIRRDDPRAVYGGDMVRDILRVMVLDRELEEVRSTEAGEFAAVQQGAMCYRMAGSTKVGGGLMEEIPCGVCHRIDQCSPEGVVSPATCVYYKRWLKLDF